MKTVGSVVLTLSTGGLGKGGAGRFARGTKIVSSDDSTILGGGATGGGAVGFFGRGMNIV
jgi:hypothetical protein